MELSCVPLDPFDFIKRRGYAFATTAGVTLGAALIVKIGLDKKFGAETERSDND